MTDSQDLILKEDHLDFLIELLTIGAGKSSEILSEMLGTHMQLSIPSIKQIQTGELGLYIPRYLDNDISVIDLLFKGSISGESKLIFPVKSARTLGNMLLEESDNEDFDSAKIGVLTEVGNIVLNSIMGTISNFLNISFEYQIPVYQSQFHRKGPSLPEDSQETVLLANTRFTADEISVQGDIALLFSLESLENLVRLMDNYLDQL